MLATAALHMRVRPVYSGLVLACGAVLVVVALVNLLGYARFLTFRAELERALTPGASGSALSVAWSFPFQESRCSVSLDIDRAELEAAGRVSTSAIFGSRGWLRRAYVVEVVNAQADSPVIERLAREFRRIRSDRALNADEYLELMAAGIQAIPYGDTESETLLAAEVLGRGSGICTDKSLLLGSLLVHEGYDTVLWVFSTQRHVAVGVASDAAQFQGSGYAFVETTIAGYVGQAAPAYRASGPVAKQPTQIALGGSKRYGAGGEVEVILRELRRLQALASASAGYTSLARTPAPQRDRYAARAMENWIADATATFILTNTHDRRGVYAIVSSFPAGVDGPSRPSDL